MSTIVTRAGKGSPLTNTEVDSNFTNLNTDKVESITSADGSVVVSTSGTTRDLSVGIAGSTATLISQVRNQTGATLTKGTLVYISGASGNKALVSKALATGDATSAQTYGMVQADIPHNQNGYVVVIGVVSGLDTSTFTEGVQLYLSPTTAGTYTSTKPYAPNHLVYIGVVTRVHANQGTIEVKIQNGYEMDEIHDVSAQSPTNGDTLVYNSTTTLWTKTAQSTLSVASAAAVPFSGVTSTPTTLSGYGITDAYSSSNPSGYITSSALSPYLTTATAASTYLPLAGGTLTGKLTLDGRNEVYGVPTNAGTIAGFMGGTSGGTTAARTQSLNTQTLLNIAALGYTGSAWVGGAGLSFVATENQAAGTRGTKAVLSAITTGDSTATTMEFNGSALTINGSTAVTSSNYNSYAPTLTGTGATGTWAINITGSAGSAGSASSATVAARLQYADGPRDLSDRLPNTFTRTVVFDFVGAGTGNGSGNYAGVMTFSPWIGTTASTGDSSYQLSFANTTGVNASGQPKLSIRNGIDSTWNAWYVLLHSGNVGSYALPLSGGTVAGPVTITGNDNQLIIDATSGATAGIFLRHGNVNRWEIYNSSTSSFGLYNYTTGQSEFTIANATGVANFRNTPTAGSNAILHAGNYDSYALPLSGGTMTNAAVVRFGWDDNLDRTAGATRTRFSLAPPSHTGAEWTFVTYDDNSYANMRFGYGDANTLNLRHDGYLTVAGNLILNSSNYSSYALPLSGGTLTGILTANAGGRFLAPNDEFFSFTNVDSDSTHYTSRGGRILTSNGSNWASDGKDAVIAITRSSAGTTRGQSIGLTLHNENNTTNAYSPAIVFSAVSNSGSYNSMYAAIMGKKTGQNAGVDSNWNKGELHFYAVGDAYVADTPHMRLWNGGDMETSSSIRSPIFYDYNNTAYYLDPNAGTSLNAAGDLNFGNGGVNTGAAIYHGAGAGDYGRIRFYQAGTNNQTIHVFPTAWQSGTLQSASAGSINISGANGVTIGAWNNNDMWIDTGGISQSRTSSRAPIFYDSNDTGYYLDPASSTTSLKVGGALTQGSLLSRPYAVWGAAGDSTGAVVIKLPGSSGNYGMIHAVIDIYEYSGNNVSTIIIGGHNWGSAWHYIGANVTGYTNKPVRLCFVGGQYAIVIGNDSSTWSYGQVVLRKIQNGSYYSGVMDLGGTYTSYLTTSVGASWDSGDLNTFRSTTITGLGSVRAPIFYDSDNTACYVDPASTSILNTIGFNGTSANAFGNYWAGGAGYPAYQFSGGNSRFGFSSTAGVVDVYADGNFYATDSGYLVLHTANYNSYSPTLTGTGASGTWGINITGNSATATTLQTNGTVSFTTDNSGFHVIGAESTGSNVRLGAAWNRPGIYNGSGTTAGGLTGSITIGSENSIYFVTQNVERGRFDNSGIGYASASFRAPIFYDSDNTAYFVNPTSNSLLSSLAVDFDFRAAFASGVGGTTFSSSHYSMGKDTANGSWSHPHYSDLIIGYHTGIRLGAAYSGIRFYNNSPTTDANNDGNGDVGEALLMTVGGYVGTANSTDVYVNNNLFAGSSMRAPIFYDSGNTAYYTDPAGTSVLNQLELTGANHHYLYINPGNGYEAMVRYNGGTGSSWYVGKRTASDLVGTGNFHFYSEAAVRTVAGIDTSGNFIAYGNVTAYSDERLKTNWQPMPENYVTRLAQVKVGIYDRTNENGITQVGVSAQSLQELLPQAILTAQDEMQTLSVAYGNAALASAVELAKEVVDLRNRVAHLESLIHNLIGD